MAKGKGKKLSSDVETADYRHADEKRKNIPPARIAAEGKVPALPKAQYAYSPHLPPTLRFDPTRDSDALPELLQEASRRPLKPDELRTVADALRLHEPWLEWAGKREQHARKILEVDPVVLHMHERVSARAIIRSAQREDVQREMFADPELSYEKEVKFYQHDVGWANRLILGDSLQVMTSLSRRECLAGKVQMIYFDPPYGIQYKSNFQPECSRVDVKDKDQDLTRHPETVKAFRDTWELGVHSYLTYLRDRFSAAKDLLADTGSVFVQIGPDNLHRVRAVMDEVFGPTNFVSQIAFVKTSSSTSNELSSVYDQILWYRKSEKLKYRPIFELKKPGETGATGYKTALLRTGEMLSASRFEDNDGILRLPEGADLVSMGDYTSQSPGSRYDVWLNGKKYRPEPGYWKTDQAGMGRILKAERLAASADSKYPAYVRKISDFCAYPLGNMWTDTLGQNQFGGKKVYATQTALKVVQRCIQMTTDPGDLVLDPTCGSGTTAYLAEQWGRRWITIDTSRVAITIARQRMLTAQFRYYALRPITAEDRKRNPSGPWLRDPTSTSSEPCTLRCRTVPHIEPARGIAQNANLDPIFAKHEPVLDAALKACNTALQALSLTTRRTLEGKLAEKQRAGGKRAITEADRRRWQLPAAGASFESWTVPFDVDPDYPKELREAVTAYRKAWRAKMDEVDACIAQNAEQEDLVDLPEPVKDVLRVSGPFSVEGVRPGELSLGNELTPDDDGVQQNQHAYLSRMLLLLRHDGIMFINNKHRRFARVEPLYETATGGSLHAEGVFEEGDASGPATVAVTFGPQYGPVTAEQVEDAIRSSKRHDELVIAGFSFDAAASSSIQENAHPKLRIHQAYIRPDENPAMDGLLKDKPGSQIFTVFGQPEVEVKKDDEGDWTVRLAGVDIYDPVENAVKSTGADKVAAWFLDSDFDGRCFCMTQAFFPDQDAWDKIAKALGADADTEPFRSFKGTTSLPFKAGKHKRVAVKVIDPRGNEVMAVRALGK